MKSNTKEYILLDYLHKCGEIDLNEASKILNVSESTARRVFNNLQGSGAAFRTHGGIKLLNEATYSFQDSLTVNAPEKQAIGKKACGLIQSGDVVYLDCGTTLSYLCREIADALQSGRLKGLQLFTNSLPNMELLAAFTTVNMIGGTYRPKRKDFTGLIAKNAMRGVHFNCCFLGADGVGQPLCPGAMDFETADLNMQVVANSDKVHILCDSAKFAKPALVSYAQSKDVDCVVTDESIPESFLAHCQNNHIQVLKAAVSL